MNEIYFDNSATTRVCDEALAVATHMMREEYGNPSSVHRLGTKAFHNLNEARETMAALLRTQNSEVTFTSCGTEANNTAIFGAVQSAAKSANRILVSSVEHASVSEPAKLLLNKNWDVHFLPVDAAGAVRLEALESLLDEKTALVSVIHVNNETGTIQPLTEIGALIRQKAPQAFFHVDGVQSFARIPTETALWRADAFSASGHKLHAPKGVGMLWLKQGCNWPPFLRGGGQESGFRSGTENMPGICAFATAASSAVSGMQVYAAQMAGIKQALVETLQEQLPDVYLNGPPLAEAAPHIVNLSFLGCRSEVLLHYLEEKGLYVSAGSACNSRSSKGSQVLVNMGLSSARIDSALRFSFSRFNTMEEVTAATAIIIPAVEEIRKIMGNKKRR